MIPVVKISAVAICMCHASAALSADYKVKRSIELSSSPSATWNTIGDFCDIDDWHPNVSGCTLKVVDGTLVRVLTTGAGNKIEQKRVYQDGLLYSYTTVDHYLPIENYRATLSITPMEKTLIEWTANFSSDDPAMEQIVVKEVEDGMSAIEEIFMSE